MGTNTLYADILPLIVVDVYALLRNSERMFNLFPHNVTCKANVSLNFSALNFYIVCTMNIFLGDFIRDVSYNMDSSNYLCTILLYQMILLSSISKHE